MRPLQVAHKFVRSSRSSAFVHERRCGCGANARPRRQLWWIGVRPSLRLAYVLAAGRFDVGAVQLAGAEDVRHPRMGEHVRTDGVSVSFSRLVSRRLDLPLPQHMQRILPRALLRPHALTPLFHDALPPALAAL